MERYYEKMEQLRAQSAPILEQLKNNQIPDAYPEAELQFPFFQGRSLNEGSLYFREEINRLCGFCFLSYNWIRPLSYLDWGPPMLGDHVWFRRPQLCSAVLWDEYHRYRRS